MHRGWVKIYRCLSDNPYWQEKPFTRGQVWVDIILLANHKDGHIRKRGVLVEVKRGQIGHSQTTLADRWGWSRGKVIRFLRELETAQQIVQQKTNVTSLITVVNYNEYQSDDITNGTAGGTASSTADEPQTVQEQEGKNDKNDKKQTPLATGFENFWKLYPKKVAKKSCFEIWKRKHLHLKESLLVADIKKRISSCCKWKGGYIPNPQTYLNGERWEDEIEKENNSTQSAGGICGSGCFSFKTCESLGKLKKGQSCGAFNGH
jgi:hypothetical protein